MAVHKRERGDTFGVWFMFVIFPALYEMECLVAYARSYTEMQILRFTWPLVAWVGFFTVLGASLEINRQWNWDKKQIVEPKVKE